MEICLKEGNYVLHICKYVLKAHKNVLFMFKYVLEYVIMCVKSTCMH
jgi:hypothetical protein